MFITFEFVNFRNICHGHKKERIVHQPPLFSDFKPIGVKMNFLKKISLSIDEYEAFRLADYVGLSHDDASNEMDISRSTFYQTY